MARHDIGQSALIQTADGLRYTLERIAEAAARSAVSAEQAERWSRTLEQIRQEAIAAKQLRDQTPDGAG